MKRSRKGSVLVLALWVTAFLSITALSLGQRGRIGLALVEAHIREVKAKGLAWAGVIDSIDRIRQDQFNAGRFDLDDGTVEVKISDEAQRINLNAAAEPVLSNLAVLSGLDEPQSHALTEKAMKQRPIHAAEELAIESEKLNQVITIYPKVPMRLKINPNKAPAVVMQAVTRSLIDDKIVLKQDADRLVEKILAFRAGEDGREGTSDDKSVDLRELDLDTNERMLAEKLVGYLAKEPEYVRIHSLGRYKNSDVEFEAVVYRPALSIVDWRKR